MKVQHLRRRDLDLDRGPVPAFTNLAIERGLGGGQPRHRLPVADSRLPDPHVQPMLPQQPVFHDLEVKLAHTTQDCLAGLVVRLCLQRRIVQDHQLQRAIEIGLLCGGLRLHEDTHNRLRERDVFEDDLLRVITERIAGNGFLEAHDPDNVARADLLHLLPFIGIDEPKLVGSLSHFAVRIVDSIADFQPARINAKEGQGAVRIRLGLKDQTRQRRLRRMGPFELLVMLARMHAAYREQVHRGRKEINEGLKNRLDTLVRERGTAKHRTKLLVQGALAECGTKQVLRDRLIIDKEFEQFFGTFGGPFDHRRPRLFGRLLHRFRDLGFPAHRRVHLPVKSQHPHLNEINDAGKIVALSNRDLDR